MTDISLTKEDIERLKARDERFRLLDAGLKLQCELRDSVALQMVLDKIEKESDKALEALATVDPTDTKAIISLQARVERARFTFETINHAILRGTAAGQSLSEEASIALSDEQAG